MAEKILIVSAANERYHMGLLTSLHSLLTAASAHYEYDIKVIDNGINQSSVRLIKSKLKSTGRKFQLEFIQSSGSEFSGFGRDYGLGISAYLRLLIPDLFPQYERAIYVDSDIIFKKDVSPLWQEPFEGYLLMAVQDYYEYQLSAKEYDPQQLVVEKGSGYFNSGFLVLDLKSWRERNISGQLIEYIEKHRELCPLWDQSALNVFFHKNWKALPAGFNQPAYEYSVEKAEKENINCHFLGPCKPWFLHCVKEPYSLHFYAYLTKMGMKDWSPPVSKHYWQKGLDYIKRKWFS